MLDDEINRWQIYHWNLLCINNTNYAHMCISTEMFVPAWVCTIPTEKVAKWYYPSAGICNFSAFFLFVCLFRLLLVFRSILVYVDELNCKSDVSCDKCVIRFNPVTNKMSFYVIFGRIDGSVGPAQLFTPNAHWKFQREFDFIALLFWFCLVRFIFYISLINWLSCSLYYHIAVFQRGE